MISFSFQGKVNHRNIILRSHAEYWKRSGGSLKYSSVYVTHRSSSLPLSSTPLKTLRATETNDSKLYRVCLNSCSIESVVKRYSSNESSEKKHQSPIEKRWPAPLRPSETEFQAISNRSESALKELEEEYNLYREAKLKSGQKSNSSAGDPIEEIIPSNRKKFTAAVREMPTLMWKNTIYMLKYIWEIISEPSKFSFRLQNMKLSLKEMCHHYYLGSKLLWNDIKTTKKIVSRMLIGHTLSRREHKQLLRTSSDIFRMVPLTVFVVIPFMEFLLPFALKIFPNMLPSTFQDTLKQEEDMKKELKMRLALAGFLHDTVEEMARRKKKAVEGSTVEDNVVALKELQEFIEKAKLGKIGNDDITRFARLFKDELTLENISRAQLVNLCRFMGLAPYGGDNFLRFQLRVHLRNIKQDDQRILWEGVNSLTKQELQEACRERGMRAVGLTKEGYRRQLSQWLDLSTTKAVPISLLIMSRAFTFEAPDPASALAMSIGSMDSRVVTEVMIEAASSEEMKTPEFRAMKLESLERQNELIDIEHKKREEVLAKKQAKVESTSDKVSATAGTEGQVQEDLTAAAATIQKEPAGEPIDSKAEMKEFSDSPKDSESPKKKREITADELQALKSLTNPDSMSQEKAKLAQMKAHLNEKLMSDAASSIDLDRLAAESVAEKGSSQVSQRVNLEVVSSISTTDEPSKEALKVVEMTAAKVGEVKSIDLVSASTDDIDMSVRRVQKKLAGMLDKLEVAIETAEAKIGDKFHMLDRDRDGRVSAEELAFVIQHVLSSQPTEEEALAIVQELDVDRDGQISVQELIDWVQKHNEEAGEVFDDLFSMQKDGKN